MAININSSIRITFNQFLTRKMKKEVPNSSQYILNKQNIEVVSKNNIKGNSFLNVV